MVYELDNTTAKNPTASVEADELYHTISIDELDKLKESTGLHARLITLVHTMENEQDDVDAHEDSYGGTVSTTVLIDTEVNFIVNDIINISFKNGDEMVTFNKQTFNNKEYNVYDNANFSIIVDRYCNATCTFCVEDLRNQSKLKKSLRYDQFIPNVEKALSKMRALNTSISLTGGEPTASAAFVDLVKLIDKYDFRKKVVTTNGSYLTARDFRILDALIDANWDHLNISKTHYDESVNNKLM